MTIQEWKDLTEEERLKLFEELQVEKDIVDKELEKFLKEESKQSDDEKWIFVNGLHGRDLGLRVSDINYIETDKYDITRIYTKIIHNEENIILSSSESPNRIVNRINTSNK